MDLLCVAVSSAGDGGSMGGGQDPPPPQTPTMIHLPPPPNTDPRCLQGPHSGGTCATGLPCSFNMAVGAAPALPSFPFPQPTTPTAVTSAPCYLALPSLMMSRTHKHALCSQGSETCMGGGALSDRMVFTCDILCPMMIWITSTSHLWMCMSPPALVLTCAWQSSLLGATRRPHRPHVPHLHEHL